MSLTQAQTSIVQHQAGHQILTPAQRLASVNEETWLQVGKVAEMMNDLDRAMAAYESALRQNPYSVPAMNQIATILRAREQFPRAVEYFQSILNLDQNNGETWGSLGHCYLMMDDLQKAYSAYQQALYHLQNPKEPKLWYGIGILYDRYGSLEHAEEAFSQVMRMDSTFEKANEIYFRLGIIYKQQHKYSQSLECFRYIINNPPKPLTEADIWFQIGHVYEQQKEYGKAKEAYERVLRENPDHAKVLQQLGWLYHQQSSAFSDQDLAVQFLTKSLESDGADAQSWYLLGRCYMAQRKYNKAYEAYQQAVYRDGRNPTFWCSIGVLYYQINQYRDALDAYSRAIRLNPYISEVWYDLGTLYESCNNQVSDALDAYSRAAELDPGNPHIKSRLELLRSGQSGGTRPNQNAAPHPQDVNPSAYQIVPQGPPTQWSGQQQQQQQQLPPPPPLLPPHLQNQQQQQQQQQAPPHQQQQQHQQQQHSQQLQHSQHQQHSQLPQQQQQQQHHHQSQHQQQQQLPPQQQQQQQQHHSQQQQQQQHQHHHPLQHQHQHQQPSQQQNQSRGQHSAPFRPSDHPNARNDPSPESHQIMANGNKRNSVTKIDGPHGSPYPNHSQNYAPNNQSHPFQQQSHMPPMSQGPTTSLGGNSLAPMLGRTSPITELKSIGDSHIPKPQLSPVQTPQQLQHHEPRSPHQESPSKDDGASLKRPRDLEDSKDGPDAKRKEPATDSASNVARNMDRIDQDVPKSAESDKSPVNGSEEQDSAQQESAPNRALSAPSPESRPEAPQSPPKAATEEGNRSAKDNQADTDAVAERKIKIDEDYDDENED